MKFEKHFLDDCRDRVPISQVIGSYVSWDRKKTRTAVGDYWACCPFHGESSPSFHCEDKKGRYHCFGCGASGDHFKFIMEMDGKEFPAAVEEIASLAGLSLPQRSNRAQETEAQKAEKARRAKAREDADRKRSEEARQAEEERIGTAKEIWQATRPFAGSLAEVYMEWRCPGIARHCDENVRFHPSLPHPDVPGRHPTVIAKVVNLIGRAVGIWRIYLAADGRGKLQVPEGSNAKLGLGPTAGGAVRLGGISPHIGICEGVETATAVRELGIKIPVWPALSTSGIIGFAIPEGVESVIVFPDPDGSKLKTRRRHDGSTFIAQPPGMVAFRKFVENNPGHSIRAAEAAWDADYLAVLQKIKGVPIR